MVVLASGSSPSTGSVVEVDGPVAGGRVVEVVDVEVDGLGDGGDVELGDGGDVVDVVDGVVWSGRGRVVEVVVEDVVEVVVELGTTVSGPAADVGGPELAASGGVAPAPGTAPTGARAAAVSAPARTRTRTGDGNMARAPHRHEPGRFEHEE